MKTVHAVLISAIVWCMGITASFGQTIMTDKEDYEPGETVIFNGDGFEAGETVDLRALGNTNMTQIHHQVAADDMGSIAGSFLLPLIYEEIYELTATGQSSGIVAQTSFLDGFSIFRVSPTASGVTATCGSTITFTTRAGTPSLPIRGATIQWQAADGAPASFTSPATTANGLAMHTHTVGSTHGLLYTVRAFVTASGGGNHDVIWSVTPNCPVTTVPPAVTCPADIVVNNAQGQNGANVTVGGASATGTPNPTISYSPSSGFFVLGTTAVTATATNSAGNDQCSFNVTVNDVEDPVISGMPSDQTVYTGPGASTCDATASWIAPTASDNSGSANLLSSHAPGSSFPVGTTTVTYTAMDAAGNSASASFDVTVIDNTNPVISGIPSNISMGTGPGNPNPSVAVSWTPPTASDNCPGVGLSSTHNPGDVFTIAGSPHTVTYTAVDGAANQASRSFNVTVYDDTPPVISGLSSPLSFDVCEVVDLGTPTVTDNYDPNPTASNNAPTAFQIGQNTVQWTAMDGSGNSSMFAQTVTIGYGAVEGFLPPMSMDGSAIKIKKGRTVPVKFRLVGCPGTSNVVANIFYQLVNDNNIPLENPLEAVGTSAADIGNQFRYTSDDQYHFNLNTSSSQWAVNKKYRIIARLLDGQEVTGYISVTK